MTKSNDRKPFILANEKGLYALKFWLKTVDYNNFIQGRDSRGNAFIGLSWDAGPKIRKRKGIIRIKDQSLFNKAVKKVEKFCQEKDDKQRMSVL